MTVSNNAHMLLDMLSALAGLGFPRSRAQLVVPLHCDATANVTQTDATAAAMFFAITPKFCQWDLQGFTEARIIAHIATTGVAGTVLRLVYSLAYPTLATDGVQLGAAGQIEASLVVAAAAVNKSAWVPIAAAARAADVFIFGVTAGGDGVADPAIRQAFAQFR